MRTLLIIVLTFTFCGLVAAQNEQAPVIEASVKFKNFSYQDIRDFKPVDLRTAVAGKKLALVVYFAPWCPNWKHQAPFTQKLYDKYKQHGLEIIGVGEYDTVDNILASVDSYKIKFPVVYETTTLGAKYKSKHYEYRKEAGDTRNWGSPWNIFLFPAKFPAKGDVLTEKTFLVNGELIEADAEKFIREKLGLPATETTAPKSVSANPVTACEPITLNKPAN